MSIQGLPTEVVQFPFAAGLDTKTHDYLVDPPGLVRALDVEFDEVGALRLRKPYASIGTNILGGGTLSSVRKIAVVDSELLAFTSTILYSWSETLTKWVSKGEHLAVAVTEATRFGNTNDQVFADRAQLSGVVVMVWVEVLASSVLCYLAAYDATTGVVLIAPTSFGSGNSRPRVVALATKFLVSWFSGSAIVGSVLDPVTLSFALSGAGTATLASLASGNYDIVKDPNADQAVYVACVTGGAEYKIGKVTTAAAVTTTTQSATTDGVIALSCAPTDFVQVVRSQGTDIKGDAFVVSTLTNTVVGTTVGVAPGAGAINRITAAHRSVTDGGFYRCYVYWTAGESATAGVSIYTNWIDTNAAVGTEGSRTWDAGIASRAFDYNGSIYLWTVFASTSHVSGSGGASAATALGVRAQLQNTYILRRDDGHLVSKATWSRAGGYGYYTGHLPGVALISGTTGYAWAGQERQIVVLGGDDQSSYAARAPRDIVFTFDSDDARRVIQLGRTAYVSGGLLLQYDGAELVEVGFMQYPWRLDFTATAAGSSIPAGAYNYKSTYRYDNARGETERSTTAIGAAVTIAINDQINVTASLLRNTRKTSRAPAVEHWRQVKDAPVGAPFYLVTSKDPAATGDNGYVDNSSGALSGDVFVDATLTTKEQSPENASTLPRLAPPGASILAASDTRLFLAGIPGEPNRVWYSLLRGENEIVAFHGALSFALPTTTGAITALAFLAETLVVFTATAIYIMPGEGFDNTGGGSNYGPPRLVPSDVGALSHDTVAPTPGGLVFFSRKGWYRLTLGWTVEYIGAKVEDYNSDTWVAAQVVESQHQVRFLSSSRMLVLDYLVDQWSEWSQASGKDLAVWRTSPMLLDTAVKKEQSTYTAVDYSMDIETGWIKLAGLQGMVRVRRVGVLGKYKAAHKQRIRLSFDYATTATDDASMTFTGLTVGGPTQLRQGPSRQRVEAIKVRITITATDGTVPAFDAVTLTGLALEYAVKRGLYQRLPAAQKQ